MTHPSQPTFDVRPVPLDLIDQGEQLIRDDQNDDSLIELAADLATNGLLQPIGVQPRPDGRFQLLYGARRVLAAARLHWPTIPAHIHEPSAQPVAAIAARENLLRRQLSLKEECDVVSRLHHEENRSPEQIASLVGKGRAWVLRRLSIPHLPLDLREPLLSEQIALGVAETLALLDDPSMRSYALNHARLNTLSVAQCRDFVAALQSSPNIAEAVEAGAQAAASPVAYQPILMACQACDTPRPIAELRIVRVCANGCPTQETQTHEPTAH